MTENFVCERCAMAVVFAKDKILYTRELIYGKLVTSLPKGHLERGESVVQAAVRECREETGVDLSNVKTFQQIQGFSYFFTDLQKQSIAKEICPVVFRLSDERPTCITEPRIMTAAFVPVDVFLSECSYENVKQVVLNALSTL